MMTMIGIKEENAMKKIIITLAAIAAAFSMVSCDKETSTPEGNPAIGAKTVIFASTENRMTKTALDGNDSEGYKVVWSAGDSFTIGGETFTLSGEAGKTSGTFEGTVPADGDYTVYYPSTYNGTDWPAAQTYAEGNIAGSPMKAEVTVADSKMPASIKFYNEGGVLRLTVKGTATVASIEVMAAELSTSINLSCGSGVDLTSEGSVFHIAMPSESESATYTDVNIILTDTEGKKCTKAFKGKAGLVIERSKITKASFSASDFKAPVTYNAGDLVEIDGHNGIVVDLGGSLGKVIVATMNVGAKSVNGSDCFGVKKTYDEACAAWSGWRLPTVDELTAFCDPWYLGICGDTYGVEGGTGAVMWNIDGVDGIDLYLPLNDNDEYGNPSDIYWTGTTDDGGATYYYFAPAIDWENDYFPFEADYIRKEAVDKSTNKFLVRLFHNLP